MKFIVILTLVLSFLSFSNLNMATQNQFECYSGYSEKRIKTVSLNPLFHFALRYLAKSFIKKTIKKEVNENINNRVARYGLNHVANTAVDSVFDYLYISVTESEKDMVVQHWSNNNTYNHFYECPLCNDIGNIILFYGDSQSTDLTEYFLNEPFFECKNQGKERKAMKKLKEIFKIR